MIYSLLVVIGIVACILSFRTGRKYGYALGIEEGSDEGYDEGYTAGYDKGYCEGYDEGYPNGHENGTNEANAKITFQEEQLAQVDAYINLNELN